MKKTTALILSILTVSVQQTQAFTDIRPGSQLEKTVSILESAGILSGYPDGSFKPEQSINRAEALKMIFATIQENEIATIKTNPFPDVPSTEWFAPFIHTAKEKNIISGYPDGRYRPSQFVNRAEFIKIAMSALPFFETIPQDKGKAVSTFEDVYDPLWYTTYVSAALELDLLPETPQLRPTEPMQRQDAAEIILNIHQYLNDHPKSTAKNIEIPYVPEEAFLVIDPTIKNPYNPKEFGPDRLTIKRGPQGTEITNTYSGYHVSIPELVSARALEISDWQLTIDYFNRQCMMDIYTRDRKGMSAQDFVDKRYLKGDPTSPLTTSLSTSTNAKGLTIHHITATWANRNDTETPFIMSDDHIYHFSAFGYGGTDSEACAHLEPEIIETFEIL